MIDPLFFKAVSGNLETAFLLRGFLSLMGSGGKVAMMFAGGMVLGVIAFGNMIVLRVTDDVRRSRVREDFHDLSSEVERYKERVGRYPTTEQGLEALVEIPAIEPVPERWERILRRVPPDVWLNPYRYRLLPDGDSRKFEILSAGPDSMFGNKDDISSLDP